MDEDLPVCDPRFEFNAPRFYDFERLSTDGPQQTGDEFFDTAATAGLSTPMPQCPDSVAKHRGKPRLAAYDDEDMADAETESTLREDSTNQAAAEAAAKRSNIVTSWGDRLAAAASGSAFPSATVGAVGKAVRVTGPQQKQQQQHSASGPSSRTSKTPKKAGPSSLSGTPSAVPAGKQPSSAKVPAKPRPPAPTKPHSPQLRSNLRARTGEAPKSSEELALERVAAEAAEAARLSRRNEAAVQRMLAAAPPAVSAGPPAPAGAAACAMDVEQTATDGAAGCGGGGASTTAAVAAAPSGSGKRRRLHAMEPRSRDTQASTQGEWKSLAQQVGEFPLRSQPAAEPSIQLPPHGVTIPHAPRLVTATRKRQPAWKTREQIEEEEMAAIPPFHALPVNHVMLHSGGQSGLSKVEPRPPTQPKSPCLATQQRAELHPAEVATEPKQAPFRAQPLNPRILEHATFEPKRAEQPPTRPRSPTFATAARARQAEPASALAAPTGAAAAGTTSFVFGAQPAAGADAGGKARRAGTGAGAAAKRRDASGLTAPQPFQLQTDHRGEQKQAALQRALEQQAAAEREAFTFRAAPLPPTTERPALLPVPPEAPLCVPKPFHLESEVRHEQARVLRERQNLQEEEARRAATAFHARPAPASLLQAPAFAPQPSEAPLTAPASPRLAVAHRAEQRSAFDEAVAAKQREQEAERRAEEAARQAAEEERQRQQRKATQFKARPMPSFDTPFVPEFGPQQFTHAKTPPLATKSRAKQR